MAERSVHRPDSFLDDLVANGLAATYGEELNKMHYFQN
jgi:hypothetical protein